jgi:hypothetical protein
MFIDEALSFVGKHWFERDYQPAIMFFAAHNLALEEAAAREIPIGGGDWNDSDSEVGPPTTVKISEVTSVKVGDTSISLSSSRDTSTGTIGGGTGGAGGGATWTDSGLTETIYGQRYLDLRRRSNPEIIAVIPRLF